MRRESKINVHRHPTISDILEKTLKTPLEGWGVVLGVRVVLVVEPVGIGAPVEVDWLEVGLDPIDVVDWLEVELDPFDVVDWIEVELDPIDVGDSLGVELVSVVMVDSPVVE